MQTIIYPLLVFVSTAAWAAIHSWMAALSTKALARRIFDEQIDHFYRLIFVFVAVLTLLPILAMLVLFPSRLLWIIPPPWLYLTLLVQIISGIMVMVSVIQTDLMIFVGWRQLKHPDIEWQRKISTAGLYGFVRHPQFLFGIILIWLMPVMTDLILAFNIASTLYFLIGTFIEESKLRKIFEEEYKFYQQEVPRIIPGIKS